MAIDIFNKADVRRIMSSRGTTPFDRGRGFSYKYLSWLHAYWFDLYGSYVTNQLFIETRRRPFKYRTLWIRGF